MTAFDDAMDGIPESRPVTAVDVDALAKLREAATAGPWVTDVSAGSAEAPLVRAVGTSDGFEQVHVGGFTGFRGTADAALIVAAVNALPDLLAEVRRGRALREAVDGLAETWERRAKAYGEHDDRDKVTELRQRATALRAVLAAVDANP